MYIHIHIYMYIWSYITLCAPLGVLSDIFLFTMAIFIAGPGQKGPAYRNIRWQKGERGECEGNGRKERHKSIIPMICYSIFCK